MKKVIADEGLHQHYTELLDNAEFQTFRCNRALAQTNLHNQNINNILQTNL